MGKEKDSADKAKADVERGEAEEDEARAKTGQRPPKQSEAEIPLADITASKGLGWEPRVDIGEGLSRTIEYLRTKVLPAKVGFTGT